MSNKKMLCVYHGNCADGFGAAWVVRLAFGEANVEFFPGVYGQPPPMNLIEGRKVVIVDFSYKRDQMLHIASKAMSVLVLDHHRTAEANLNDIVSEAGRLGWFNLNCVFDMKRSGAMIAWDHYFYGEKPPRLLEHIQDRDLWLFKLEGTREIQANLFSYPYDFAVWDYLMDQDPAKMFAEGAAIERKHHKDIGELVSVSKRRMVIGGYDVPVANLPYTLSSDAGHLMGKGEPFAACYMDQPQGRVFSLRSNEDGVDVSAVAARYGGGGHKHAAGFTVAIGWEGEQP